MTVPDPDPATTTGLEPGGGVPPGETPPGEAGIAGISHQEAPRGTVITPVALAVIISLVLVVAAFIVGKAVSLF